jgi:phosphoribosylformimino-5-aminoimidazole carboxamide ribotide isomerase
MDVIPAVDLMDGRVVRLVRGDPKKMKPYEQFGDPVEVAKKWEREGADFIHVIDLDAALGRGSNLGVIGKIVKAVSKPVQVGGGIRSFEAAQKLFQTGVTRVILGSLAFKEPELLKRLLKVFGGDQVVVALDYRGDEVMVRGWKSATKLSLDAAVEKFVNLHVIFFLVTSITRDGTLTGPDYDTLVRVSNNPEINVIAAGGIGSLEDLKLLKRSGVQGVVIGKALYEGAFKLKDALEVAK